MNCPFCHKFNENSDDDNIGQLKIYYCQNCFQDWWVEYTEPNSGLYYIAIFNDFYIIELMPTKQATAFYDLMNPPRNPDDHACLRLNHLIDVSPQTTQQWVEKLINLKAFV